MNRCDRTWTEHTLAEHLSFEELISNLSTRFIDFPAERIDEIINEGLEQIGAHLSIDRIALLQFSTDASQLHLTHGYAAPGQGLPPKFLVSTDLPWFSDSLRKGHTLRISSIKQMPNEAKSERKYCKAQGIKAFLTIPMRMAETALGAISFSDVRRERDWPDYLIQQFRTVTYIFANALAWKRSQKELREREKRLRYSQKDLRKFAGRLISVQEEERRRLAREIHDDLTQRLAVLAMEAGIFEKTWKDLPGPVLEKLSDMKNQLVKISEDVHSISRQLHPSILDDLGLVRASESECVRFSKREGLSVNFHDHNIPCPIPEDISLGLYRIIQECLSNVARHAKARNVSIFLIGVENGIQLTIKDDGVGFDPAKVRHKEGLGLSSMRERVRLIHGKIAIHSVPGQCTEIKVQAPLKESEQ
jgi:signal transduction histidine kinase